MLSTSFKTAAAVLLVAGIQSTNAQTFTSCNPLDKSDCPSDPALGTTQTTDFTHGASSDWSLADGTTLSYGANGAEFSIKQASNAPTVSNNKYIFFGKVDAVLKAAPGQGIVSSFILESDDLDEIDWEWLGSKDDSVESNFFGKGNTTTYNRALYHNVADPIGTWHTYTIDWTSNYVKWSIDGNLVRTLNYGDALALGGQNFPQTPMKVKMGNWVGCADAAANQPSSPTYGTCQWAGGPADFSASPFTMYVKSVTIQDYSSGSSYSYGDESGSWQSIKVSGGSAGTGSGSASSGSASASASSSVSSSASGSTSVTSGSSATSSTLATSTTTASSGSPAESSAQRNSLTIGLAPTSVVRNSTTVSSSLTSSTGSRSSVPTPSTSAPSTNAGSVLTPHFVAVFAGCGLLSYFLL